MAVMFPNKQKESNLFSQPGGAYQSLLTRLSVLVKNVKELVGAVLVRRKNASPPLSLTPSQFSRNWSQLKIMPGGIRTLGYLYNQAHEPGIFTT